MVIKKSNFFISIMVVVGFTLGAGIAVYFQAHAGSLTPPGSPASTMNSLSDIAGSGFVSATDSLHIVKSSISSIPTMNPSAGLGSDMWTNYAIQQGLFTPHANNCNSSEVFVDITGSSGFGFCIEKTYRAADYWSNAKATCASVGKRLPELAEWQYTCQHPPSGWTYNSSQWEWASNFALPMYNGSTNGVATPIFGAGGCSYAAWNWVGSSYGSEGSDNFRCVR